MDDVYILYGYLDTGESNAKVVHPCVGRRGYLAIMQIFTFFLIRNVLACAKLSAPYSHSYIFLNTSIKIHFTA